MCEAKMQKTVCAVWNVIMPGIRANPRAPAVWGNRVEPRSVGTFGVAGMHGLAGMDWAVGSLYAMGTKTRDTVGTRTRDAENKRNRDAVGMLLLARVVVGAGCDWRGWRIRIVRRMTMGRRIRNGIWRVKYSE